jgi:hypothetical protein
VNACRAARVFGAVWVDRSLDRWAAFPQDAASLAMGLPARPTIGMDRYQEDWSVLAGPSLRTEPFDNFKYIPLSPDDPKSYVSLGLDLRERFESLNASTFDVGGIPVQNYVLDRELIHADVAGAEFAVDSPLEGDGIRTSGSAPQQAL